MTFQAQRFIFSKWTPPDGGPTTLFVDGLGSIITEMSPSFLKFDSAFGIKILWTRDAPVAPPVVMMQPAAETAVDKIRALKMLKDDGIITDEDFDAKKAALLASM